MRPFVFLVNGPNTTTTITNRQQIQYLQVNILKLHEMRRGNHNKSHPNTIQDMMPVSNFEKKTGSL